MALTDQQRDEVAEMLRRGTLRPTERGRLEAFRRFYSPARADADAIAAALGEAPSSLGVFGPKGAAELARRYPNKPADSAAAYWARVRTDVATAEAAAEAEKQQWMEQQYPGITAEIAESRRRAAEGAAGGGT